MSEQTESVTAKERTDASMTGVMKRAAVLCMAVLLTLSSAFLSYAENGWKRSGSVWNYYYSNGKMAKNTWIKNGDVLFWIEEDGTMATSKWHEQDHTWYYLDASGAAVTGWKEIDGKWYYFKEDHAMQIRQKTQHQGTETII